MILFQKYHKKNIISHQWQFNKLSMKLNINLWSLSSMQTWAGTKMAITTEQLLWSLHEVCHVEHKSGFIHGNADMMAVTMRQKCWRLHWSPINASQRNSLEIHWYIWLNITLDARFLKSFCSGLFPTWVSFLFFLFHLHGSDENRCTGCFEVRLWIHSTK